MDDKLKILLTEREIKAIVEDLAGKISKDYGKNHTNLIIVGVLKGAYVFLSDLTRALSIDVEVDFVRTNRYINGTTPIDKVKFLKDVDTVIKGKDVILVEDIVDKGLTLEAIVKRLKKKSPKSLKVCSLLVRRGFKNKTYKVDYKGKTISKGFVVGYGMDLDGKYRNRKAIYTLEEKGGK